MYNPRFFIVNPRPKKFSALRADLGLLKLFNTPLVISKEKLLWWEKEEFVFAKKMMLQLLFLAFIMNGHCTVSLCFIITPKLAKSMPT